MILNMADIENLGINEYLGQEFECTCGRKHHAAIDKIVIGKGVLQQIPEILRELQCKNPLLVADTNTFQAAGKSVAGLMKQTGLAFESLVYQREGDLVPDEIAIGQLEDNLGPNTDLIVAVGAGVINDLAKYVSARQGIPFMIIATAPSMDGFASDVAALILDGLKTSPGAPPARVIIGDTEVLRNAPLEMIRAGLGDMLGKYSSLKDWKLSHLLFGEYYCETVAALVRFSVQKCIANIHGYENRDEAAVQSLMEGLTLSGIAMSFIGNSRPASGSEHHISHFWEMMFLQRGKPAVLHGIKVGITALAANRVAAFLAGQAIDFDQAVQNADQFDESNWEQTVVRLFQTAAPAVLKQSLEYNRNSLIERLKRIAAIQLHWTEIVSLLQEKPSAEELKEVLTVVGAPVSPDLIGVDDEIVSNSIIYAKEIRNRYTVLQLAWDLGLIEECAASVTSYYEAF